MARKYEMTRFVMVTVVTGSTINPETFEKESFTDFLQGQVSKDDAIKESTKRHKMVKDVDMYYSGTMYGLTTEDVIRYGTALNPYTRQPWADDDDKALITMQYIEEMNAKKTKSSDNE